MSRFKRDIRLDELVDRKDPGEVSKAADAFCTNGDNDTGYEIFKSGFALAEKANGRDVWVVFGDDVARFFIGSLDEVTKRIEALADQ